MVYVGWSFVSVSFGSVIGLFSCFFVVFSFFELFRAAHKLCCFMSFWLFTGVLCAIHAKWLVQVRLLMRERASSVGSMPYILSHFRIELPKEHCLVKIFASS